MKMYFFFFPAFLLMKLCIGQNNGFTTVSIPTQFSGPPKLLKIDNQNNVWMSRINYIGRYNLDTKLWTVFDTIATRLSKYTIRGMVFDNQNNMWALTTGHGLFHYDGINWLHYDSLNGGMPVTYSNAITIQNNMLWIGTEKGALYGTPGNWTIYNTSNSGIASDTINRIFEHNNSLWFFSPNQSGLSEYKNGMWKIFDTIIDGKTILAQNITQDKNVLFVTSTYGFIYTFDGLEWKRSTILDDIDIVFYYLSLMAVIDKKIYVNCGGLFIADSINENVYYDPRLRLNNMAIKDEKMYFLFDSLYIFDPSKYITNVPINYNVPVGKYIDGNNVKSAILNNGTSNWNTNVAKYEVPKGSGKHAIYNTGLWIGGLDDGNNLHIAAQRYRQTGVDYWTGPLDTSNANIDSATVSQYNKVWKINKYDIEEFKHMYANGQVQNGNYIIPTDILTWPAQGIKNKAKNLAPFIDTNNDGKYDPIDGDYPKIKGDQMLWYIMNDNFAPHTETGGVPLGVEVHGSAYSFLCDSLNDSMIVSNYTTLYQYKLINRSDTNYHDTYIGIHCDVDLGSAYDDFIGCDTLNNIAFGYNGDNFDDNVFGYGLNPPMINIQILNGPLPPLNDGIDNNHNGIVDEQNERCMMEHFIFYPGPDNSPYGDPTDAQHHYHHLKSEWGDGSHITFGEDGTNHNNPPTNFMYSGTPYDTTGWTEITANHTPEDRRFTLSSGPFNLPAHSEQTFEYAIVYTREPNAPNGLHTSVARNIADVQKIKKWFDTNTFPSCNKYEFPVFPSQIPPLDSGLIIFPNPAIYNFTLNINDDFINASTIKIYSALGQKIYDKNISTKTINIETWHRGLYFVVVEKEGELYKGRFLKW